MSTKKNICYKLDDPLNGWSTPQQQECVMGVKKRCFLIFIILMILILPACKTLKMSPIIKATDQGQLNKVNRLLALGVDVNAATPEGVTPLFIASAKGHEDIVKRLIDKGADVNAVTKLSFEYEDQTIYEGRTSLMAALRNKHTDIAKLLIQQGADVNAVDVNGVTPLFIAAALNDEGIVKILIAKGADVNAVILTEYKYKEETVIKGATPLMAALKMEQNANAALLVAHGADVNARCEDGTDSLMIVAVNGDLRMANFLLSHGANHQTRVTKDSAVKGQLAFAGVTTLMIASGAGHMESVDALIKAGADVNAVSEKGATALMAAAAKGHLEVVKVLVANGADVNARTTLTLTIGKAVTPKGSNALGLAAQGGFDKTVKFLLENGADVNSKEDDSHMDALFLAAEHGHIKVVRILIDNGADVYAETKMGTAKDVAKHYGHPYVAQYILDAREKLKKAQEEE
ncbi:MAG: hypothetical protein HF978_18025 [Desulfobacteraceae bacterium]|nr:ankyrin repeat domain-containing protein [Desulfobacteraceae bacterium]MBC2757446.1 hypothetical protein [Desulfobacteraceae bacterium]